MSKEQSITRGEAAATQFGIGSFPKSTATVLDVEVPCDSPSSEDARDELGREEDEKVSFHELDSMPSSQSHGAPAIPPTIQSERPYSAFTKRQKWSICALASLAAIFGPISSNIFVPAIPQVGTSFRIPTQRVDLALTIYL